MENGKLGNHLYSTMYYYNIPEELGNEYKSAYIDLRDSKYHTAYYFLKNVLSEFGCDPEVILENNNL